MSVFVLISSKGCAPLKEVGKRVYVLEVEVPRGTSKWGCGLPTPRGVCLLLNVNSALERQLVVGTSCL